MANFMGPMAPPQAAQPQPAQLDIKTNPSQRAQFKSFMQGMQVQPTTAPIAPMLPAPMPSPMDQVDIFAPAPMADGGLAMPKLAGGTTNVIDGTRSGTGIENPISNMDDVDMGFANPPLPVTGLGALMSNLDASMARHNQRGNAEMDRQQAMANFVNASTPMSKMQNFAQNVMGGAQAEGPLGGMFSIKPTMRGDDMGIMASYNLSFKDGGPVRMQDGGTTFRTGDDGRTVISSDNIVREDGLTDRERSQAFDNIDNAIYAASAGRQADADRYQAMADYFLDDAGNIPALSADAQSYIKETGTPAVNPLSILSASGAEDMVGDSGAFVPPAGDTGSTGAAFDPRSMLSDPMDRTPPPYGGPAIEAVAANRSVDPIAAPDLGFTPLLDLNADVTAISPMEQFALDQDDSLAALLNDPMNQFGGTGRDIAGASTPKSRMAALAGGQINTGNENLDNRTRLRDLEIRSQGSGAPGIAGMLAKALGGGLAANVASNVFDKGRTAVLDENNQIVGYMGPGLIPGTEVYTGRAGYNPSTNNSTFDSETGAFRVTPRVNMDDGTSVAEQLTTSTTPAEPPAAPPPNMITRPDNPVTPAPTPDVVVPSPRDPVNIGGPPLLTAPNIDPIQSVGLPQSFLDLLAQFNRPAPRAMQDGGAVLDKAAGDFLEALRVA